VLGVVVRSEAQSLENGRFPFHLWFFGCNPKLSMLIDFFIKYESDLFYWSPISVYLKNSKFSVFPVFLPAAPLNLCPFPRFNQFLIFFYDRIMVYE
jgi:hypothetical protein